MGRERDREGGREGGRRREAAVHGVNLRSVREMLCIREPLRETQNNEQCLHPGFVQYVRTRTHTHTHTHRFR